MCPWAGPLWAARRAGAELVLQALQRFWLKGMKRPRGAYLVRIRS